jgi:hypothetical protein
MPAIVPFEEWVRQAEVACVAYDERVGRLRPAYAAGDWVVYLGALHQIIKFQPYSEGAVAGYLLDDDSCIPLDREPVLGPLSLLASICLSLLSAVSGTPLSSGR